MPRLKSQTAQILEAVQSLASKIDALESKKSEPEVKQTLTQTQTTESKVEVTAANVPIPLEYRQIVDQILNRNFGIRIAYDLVGFQFSVIVPDKYSDTPPSYRQMYGEDIRMKVIPNHLGANGVRDWSETIWKRFNPDTQAIIAQDRL